MRLMFLWGLCLICIYAALSFHAGLVALLILAVAAIGTIIHKRK